MKPNKLSALVAYAGSVLGAATTLVVLLVTIQTAPQSSSLGITRPTVSEKAPLHTVPSDPPSADSSADPEEDSPHVCVFSYDRTTDPTCATEGTTIYTCPCGDEQTEYIAKIDHDFTYSHTIAATCTSEGQVVYACDCGLIQSESIPMMEHSFVLDCQVDPTCTQEGKRIYACVCGKEKAESIAKVSHTYTYSHTIAATCTTEGQAIYACTCGEEQIESLAKIDHAYTYSHTIAATCTTEGQVVYACVCGLTQSESIPMTEHQYVLDRQVNPTCTQEGKRIYACICGKEKAEPIAKVDHAYTYSHTIAATCTTEGQVVYACVCGLTQSESIPMTEHQYVLDRQVNPTCTQEGKRIYACVCGKEKAEPIAKVSHVYTYSHTVQATCTAKGKIVSVCVCGKQKTEALPQKEHVYTCTATVAATQTAEGSRTYTCSGCGRSYKESIPKLPAAYMTEYCGDSLLGKALPHTTYYQYMSPILQRYSEKLTLSQSTAAGLLALPAAYQDFLAEFRVTYRYLYYTLPYSVSSDKAAGTAQFLAWSPIEKYTLLEECYAEIARILAELDIDHSTTKYDAICRINDYLCEHRYYQSGNDQNLSQYKNNSTYYSIFAEGFTCYNYSVAFQMLCLGAGIECHYYPSETMNHTWNKVYFDDGSFYWVDVCWNDVQYQFSSGKVVETSTANGVPAATVKRLRETYLLITTETLLKDHTL